MAFVMSKTQQASISESNQNLNLSHSGVENESVNKAVTTQLYLKTSETLDREVVLRRIRHHKKMAKVRNSIQSLFSSPQISEHKWLELGDTFSSP